MTSAVLYGRVQGTGKSLLGLTLGRIYGRNFTEISSGDLHASFNEWAESKQFVLGDDVTGSDKRREADMLKRLITQAELRVNAKYVPAYVVPDRVNYLFTSNHPDAFSLEDTDRRFFIHEVTVKPLPDAFYREYDAWLQSSGPAALHHYLRRYPLGDWNPNAKALRTQAKERMTVDAKSDVGAFVERLKTDPDGTLRMDSVPMEFDLYTNRQLLLLYDPDRRTRVTANGLGRELRRAGFEQVLDRRSVRSAAFVGRYYIVRNPERWAQASRAAVIKHLQGEDRVTKKARRRG